MPSKSRGGLSQREYDLKMGKTSTKSSSSSSSVKAPKAPSYGDFKFDSSKLVPQYQAEAASIYNPQIQQIQGLQALTKAQAEDAKVKTKDEFAQLLKREQENINRRGAFFSGGAIDQENRIGAQEGGALRDIGFQEQSANLQYQGTLSEIAQAQKDYVSSKVEGAYSSAYKTFQDKIANSMNAYQMELGQYNTDRAFQQSQMESDRQYQLSRAASGRAGASQAQGNLENLLSRASQMGSGGREWAVANAKTFGVNPDDVIRATYGTKEQPVDNWERAYNPTFGADTSGFANLNVQQRAGVNSIAQKFETNPIVQRYNVASEQANYVNSLGKKPTDDMARVYAFAKVMDPDSAVREGEYSTVQDYSQALLQAYGLKAKRIFTNSGFLTDEARGYIEDTIKDRESSMRSQYDNVYNEYGRRIEQITGGQSGSSYLTNCADAFSVNNEVKGEQNVNDPLGIK
jgi:hypothetical protein